MEWHMDDVRYYVAVLEAANLHHYGDLGEENNDQKALREYKTRKASCTGSQMHSYVP